MGEPSMRMKATQLATSWKWVLKGVEEETGIQNFGCKRWGGPGAALRTLFDPYSCFCWF